jgi:hypothetical protein
VEDAVTGFEAPILAAVLAASFAQEEPDASAPRPELRPVAEAHLPWGRDFSGLFEIEAATNKTDATLGLTYSRERENVPPGGLLRLHTISAAFTTPLGDDEESADFITDQGLAGVGSVTLAYSLASTRRIRDEVSPAVFERIIRDARTACLSQGRHDTAICDSLRSDLLASYVTSAEDREALGVIPADHWTTHLRIEATLGAKTYAFRDPTTFAEEEDRREPVDVLAQIGGAYRGTGAWWSGWYRGVGLHYREAYEEASSRTLCPAPPPTGPQECFTGAFAPPELDRTAALFGELRRGGLGELFGFNLSARARAAYDFEDEVWGLEGTLYVLPGGNGRLRGGVRFKLQTEDDDPNTDDDTAGIGIFVGSEF